MVTGEPDVFEVMEIVNDLAEEIEEVVEETILKPNKSKFPILFAY